VAEPINEVLIDLDFYDRALVRLTFSPVQNDSQTYKFIMTPYKNGVAYTLDPTWTYTISVLRPNNTSVIDDATEDGGKIVYTLGSSFLEQYGLHRCSVEIFDGTKRLTSNAFTWEAINETGGDEAITNTNEYPVYSEMLDHLEDTDNPHEVNAADLGLGSGISKTVSILDGDGVTTHSLVFVNGILTAHTAA
jgi:hypothetical protein